MGPMPNAPYTAAQPRSILHAETGFDINQLIAGC